MVSNPCANSEMRLIQSGAPEMANSGDETLLKEQTERDDDGEISFSNKYTLNGDLHIIEAPRIMAFDSHRHKGLDDSSGLGKLSSTLLQLNPHRLPPTEPASPQAKNLTSSFSVKLVGKRSPPAGTTKLPELRNGMIHSPSAITGHMPASKQTAFSPRLVLP